jgi:hypothetical protein
MGRVRFQVADEQGRGRETPRRSKIGAPGQRDLGRGFQGAARDKAAFGKIFGEMEIKGRADPASGRKVLANASLAAFGGI